MSRFAAIRSRQYSEFTRTSVGHYPTVWNNGCGERWQISRRNDIDFIVTISHNLVCKKQRAPLDLRPIATGLVWLRAGNPGLTSKRKTWSGDRVNTSARNGSSCWSCWHEETSLT